MRKLLFIALFLSACPLFSWSRGCGCPRAAWYPYYFMYDGGFMSYNRYYNGYIYYYEGFCF